MPIFCYSSHALLKFFTLSNLDNYIEHYMVTINAVIICGCVHCRLLNSLNLVASGLPVNSSPPGQSGCHFPNDIYLYIVMNEKLCILIKISLKFVLKDQIDDKPALV